MLTHKFHIFLEMYFTLKLHFVAKLHYIVLGVIDHSLFALLFACCINCCLLNKDVRIKNTCLCLIRV